MGFKELEELKPAGSTETGELFEQKVEINYQGESLILRRIVLKLFIPTRDKEWEIAVFSNLPENVAAAKIAEIYGNRWTIENLFQTITQNFNGEIQTLAYPKAASSYKLGRDGNRHRPVCAIFIFNGISCLQYTYNFKSCFRGCTWSRKN